VTVQTILHLPAPQLKVPAKPVGRIDEAAHALARDL
jgi:peptide deformylase